MATDLTAAAAPPGAPAWMVLAGGAAGARSQPASPSMGRVVRRFALANLVAVLVLLAGGLWAGAEAAEHEALADARRTTDLLGVVLVQPLLDARLLEGDPAAVAAVLRDRLAETSVSRLKIWAADGRVVYSDEARLIGLSYPLDDAGRRTLRDGVTRAAVSDLGRPENRFERSEGRLLEVYGRIEGPRGEPLLLETYTSYEEATERRFEIWAQFAPISMAVLLTLVAVQLPLAWRMATQLRATQRERELLQARALDASTEERRLIAGSLHDGIVQDVSASALLVARAADDLRAGPEDRRYRQVGEMLGQAAGALRESVGSLRSLLVEIHPPTLEGAGLPRALADLTARLRPRGIEVRLAVADDLEVGPAVATLLLSTVQEALRNVVKHARARSVVVTVAQQPGRLVLEITDDGVGFDVAPAVDRARTGHLGLRLLADRATAAGARLAVRTAAGAGTTLRLEVAAP